MKVKHSKRIAILFTLSGLLLLFLHGFENTTGFKIDTVSALLLVFASAPYLGSFIQKAKAGEIELSFNNPTTARSLLNSLKAISEVRKLTYYKPRDAEGGLTQAHIAIVDYLTREYNHELYEELKVWLTSDNENIKWMASEIIGFHGIADLGDRLYSLYQCKNYNERWPDWQLNCLWAHSKTANNYSEMHQFLLSTKNPHNQEWLLGAYEQMVLKGHCDSAVFFNEVSSFQNRDDISNDMKRKAGNVLKIIRQHMN